MLRKDIQIIVFNRSDGRILPLPSSLSFLLATINSSVGLIDRFQVSIRSDLKIPVVFHEIKRWVNQIP